jgi:hypothetical protein
MPLPSLNKGKLGESNREHMREFRNFYKFLEGNSENRVILESVLVHIRVKSDIRKSIECGVPECNREASKTRRPWPTGGLLQNR